MSMLRKIRSLFSSVSPKDVAVKVLRTALPLAEDAASAAVKAKLLAAGVSIPDEGVKDIVKAVADAIEKKL